jgi:hypothetical protein
MRISFAVETRLARQKNEVPERLTLDIATCRECSSSFPVNPDFKWVRTRFTVDAEDDYS